MHPKYHTFALFTYTSSVSGHFTPPDPRMRIMFALSHFIAARLASNSVGFFHFYAYDVHGVDDWCDSRPCAGLTVLTIDIISLTPYYSYLSHDFIYVTELHLIRALVIVNHSD
jgi:hypothetical protein